MTPDPDMRDLDAALAWLRKHWIGRVAPARLHGRGVQWDGPDTIEGEAWPGGKLYDEGGGSRLGSPQLNSAFRTYVDQRPDDVVTDNVHEDCYHPSLPKNREGELLCRATECPDCFGAGVKQAPRLRYRDPMWRALERLSTERARPGQAGWAHVIIAVVMSDYRPELAARLIGASVVAGHVTWVRRDFWEPMLTLAIRKLHHHYQAAPVPRPGWTELSASQQAAESAA